MYLLWWEAYSWVLFQKASNKDYPTVRQMSQPGKSLSEDCVVFNCLHCFPSRAQLCILNTGVKNSLKLFVFSSPPEDFYSILNDSGATNSFIAKQFAHKYSLTIPKLAEKIPLIILDSSESPFLFVTHHIKFMVVLPSFASFEWDFLVIDTPKGEDLISCFDLLNHLNPSSNWRQGLIIFNADHKDYHDCSNFFSNDFSSAKSFSDLVVYSRTQSFPPSVHIPSLKSNTSLMSSRDELFKEIQDVGEDNSVSLLHLFFGNMDLPPSSYHDSLEELCDEEEEPEEQETMRKVVPSAYHQYLNVFSKVKEEKLWPHHSCDHHIKLEGSLPPEALSQFHQLKEAFITSPIVSYFNPSITTIWETNASNYSLGAVLIQDSDSGKHPIAFDGCKPIPEELNYEIHDKELLGIAWALKSSRAFILSLSSPFEVHTDHSSLQDFMSSKFLTHHQACWAEFLSEFHFSITAQDSRDLSAPYHPETDGQTDHINQILEQYLWMYVSYHQDDWNTWLPLAEFANNNSDHSSTKELPFFTFYGRDPQFDSVHITQDTPAGKLSTKIQSVQKDVKRELEVAINRLKRYADKSRARPPVFNPGDMVWLSSKNIESTRPIK
ncbi:hypothetical protein O181_035003 [Austropuccinia psidii MF-1]|uniref:Reverse transcriptase RNase H-like domain-containing protein n=1 Tax=Austropuccinia psidii MF-1 TaxID=1389203 RepID=A0A9Q3D4L9_9BASI|nr:hypothetical protein [Austropuccinia psidii MF-1]